MRTVSEKNKVLETIKTHICFFLIVLLWENVQNVVEPYIPPVTIRRTHFACRIIKATNTDSEYITLPSFARRRWLLDRALVLLYTCIACLLTSYTTLCLTMVCAIPSTIAKSLHLNGFSF